MGAIKKVLSGKEIEPRYITAQGLWGDLCEDIHLHYRNVRFDFSMEEWATFACAVNNIQKGLEYSIEENKYKEGDPNFLVQVMFNTPLKSDSSYYPNRSLIELQRDNTVHFHYRDLRLHWTKTEFETIAKQFIEAYEQMIGMESFLFRDVKTPTQVTVEMDDIQPYDAGHRPLAEDDIHREGIEFVKKLIAQGEEIRPILVDTRGQRMDGFKRFMAFKELNYKTIECIVDPSAKMGGQHNHSFIADEKMAI